MIQISFLYPLVIMAAPPQANHDSNTAILAAIAGGYDENRAKFTSAEIVFDYEDGYSDDHDKARTGEIRDRCTAAGDYVFHLNGSARTYRFSRVFPESDYQANTKIVSDAETSTRLSSIQAVTDGTNTLFDQPTWNPKGGMVHNVAIYPGMDQFFTFVQFPFDLGFPEDYRQDMARVIRMALDGEGGGSIGSIELDAFEQGRKLTKFTVVFAEGTSTYWVDPEMSWVPVHRRDEPSKGPVLDFYYDDIQAAHNGGWFPRVSTILFNDRVQRLVIKSADFQTRPATSRFQLEFEKPLSIVDRARGVYYPEARTVWRLDSLPSLASAKRIGMPGMLPNSAPGGPTMPGELAPTPWYRTPVAIALAALAIVIGGGSWAIRKWHS